MLWHPNILLAFAAVSSHKLPDCCRKWTSAGSLVNKVVLPFPVPLQCGCNPLVHSRNDRKVFSLLHRTPRDGLREDNQM